MRDDDDVRRPEGVGVGLLEDRSPRRGAAGLEDGPHAALPEAEPQRLERDLHGGRVVREVVEDGDAARLADDLLASLDPEEGGEALLELLGGEALALQRGDGGDLVVEVVLADQHALEAAPRVPVAQDGEQLDAALGVDAVDAAVPLLADAVLADLARRLLTDVAHVVVVPPRHDAAAAAALVGRGHDGHELAEALLDVVEVPVDVGVVELDARDERGARSVVEELRPLVEEGGVVLVALDGEGVARAGARRALEVGHAPADQEAGVLSGGFEEPGDEGRRRRLAVRAGDDDAPLLRKDQRAEELGERAVEQLGGEERYGLLVVGADDVADDDEVRRAAAAGSGEVLRVVADHHVDPERREVVAHRRVDARVGAGDLEPGVHQHAGERGHGGAADAHDVNAVRRGIREE